MNVLVLNAGSSTLKFQLIRTDAERIEADADERLATEGSRLEAWVLKKWGEPRYGRAPSHERWSGSRS